MGQRPKSPNRRTRELEPASMAAIGGGRDGGGAKATVAENICQSVLSTSNLLHLMQESSPSQAQLIKLPKNLLARASMIKNTEQVIEQLPRVISSLDAYMENSLQSAARLKTVTQMLSNMENSQLRSIFESHSQGEQNNTDAGKVS